MAEFRSLLPFTSTSGERAIERATAEPILALKTDTVRDVKNARNCPEHILPWLAWERAVDVWGETWTLEQKVQAVLAAPYIHRHKGTAGAVRRSLAAVGYPTTIVEWWQESPKKEPYTFRVEVYTDGDINDELYEKIRWQVNREKNLRSMLSSIDVIADVYGQGRNFIGGAVTAHIDINIPAGG